MAVVVVHKTTAGNARCNLAGRPFVFRFMITSTVLRQFGASQSQDEAMIFNFYTPREDRFGRQILTCACESDYGSIDCEITYQALGKLSESTPSNFEEALTSFRSFALMIKQLWAKRIIEQGRLVTSTICLNERDLRK